MSYESALQRVGELRALAGADPTGSTTGSAAAVTPGAFDAQLAQQQALLSGSAGPGGDDAFSELGVPVLSVQDQYRMMGLPLPGGMGGMAGLGGIGGMTFPGMPTGGGAVGQRMVQLAQREIGVHESGTNQGERIREYRSATAGAEDTPGPWCAYFVSWLAKNAGAPIGAGGNGTGYVPTLEAWGKQTNRYQDVAQGRPQPGDIVIFDWGGDGTADHTGIVESVGVDGSIHTIEANASDQVMRRTYAASTNDIRGYVRPG
jgi:hypothetical protein